MDIEGTNARLVEPSRSTPTVNWTGIVLFIVLAFGISWATWLGLRALEVPFVIRTASGMFGPAIAAILVRLIRREGFADAGLRLVGHLTNPTTLCQYFNIH